MKVIFTTGDYEVVHGHAPEGGGYWTFSFTDVYNSLVQFMTPNLCNYEYAQRYAKTLLIIAYSEQIKGDKIWVRVNPKGGCTV